MAILDVEITARDIAERAMNDVEIDGFTLKEWTSLLGDATAIAEAYKEAVIERLMVQEELTRGTRAHWGFEMAVTIAEQIDVIDAYEHKMKKRRTNDGDSTEGNRKDDE